MPTTNYKVLISISLHTMENEHQHPEIPFRGTAPLTVHTITPATRHFLCPLTKPWKTLQRTKPAEGTSSQGQAAWKLKLCVKTVRLKARRHL